MDILKSLNAVNTLCAYEALTEDLSKRGDYQVPLNIAVILSLKKIRSLEVDYFTKWQVNGAAFAILQRLLQNPATKNWGLLAAEIASLVHYWLEALKKYLMPYCTQWWHFLRSLLYIINEASSKDPSITSSLSRSCLEPLLELAAGGRLDAEGRRRVLESVLLVAAAASPGTRAGLKKAFSVYFSKLGQHLQSRDILAQWAALALLVRWAGGAARGRLAEAWLAGNAAAHQVLTERRFIDFYKDSRDFLNALNKYAAEIVTVSCSRIELGDEDVTSCWLDVGVCAGRLWLQAARGGGRPAPVGARDTTGITLCQPDTQSPKDIQEVLLTISLAPPQDPLAPPDFPPGTHEVRVWISAEMDLRRVDAALRAVFGDKYENQLDGAEFNMDTPKTCGTPEEETRLSQHRIRKRAGVAIRPLAGCKSPSTASTTSLAQLHEKLAAFPRLRNDRLYPTVCAQPDLSCVSETTEFDDYKRRAIGVCTRKSTNRKARTSPSDEEVGSIQKLPRSSPAQKSYDLLDATIGPVEQSMLKEHLDENKFLDQLVREAFQKDALLDSGINSSQVVDTVPKKSCTVISKSSSEEQSVNFTCVGKSVSNCGQKKEVQQSTTTDESNTDAISDTPRCYVSTRRKVKPTDAVDCEDTSSVKPVAGLDEMLNFFNDHFLSLRDKKSDDLVISPTLAKKINASSSESSESFDQIINDSQKDILNGELENNLNEANEDFIEDSIVIPNKVEYEFNEEDVIRCLASIIDRVCEDVDQCAELINNEVMIETERDKQKETPSKKPTTVRSKKMPKIKLSFKKKAPAKRKASAEKNKLNLEPVESSTESPKTEKINTEISPQKDIEISPKHNTEIIVIQDQENEAEEKTDNLQIEEVNVENITEANESVEDANTPSIVRRKRKLYSPKDDDQIEPKTTENVQPKPKTKPLKTSAISYKEIEKCRLKFTRKTRNWRSKNAEILSPRTIKNNEVFDQMKETIENEKDIVLIERKAKDIYNFTSDSSDDDFKEKKIPAAKSTPKETITKRGRKSKQVKFVKNEPKTERKKRATKAKKVQNIVKTTPLIDERMRDATPEVMNQSFIMEDRDLEVSLKTNEQERASPMVKDLGQNLTPKVNLGREKLTPRVNVVRTMEPIPELIDEIENTVERNTQILKVKKEKGLAAKKVIETKEKVSIDVTEELPSLIIEVEQHNELRDDRSTISSNLSENVKKIMQDGGEIFVDETNATHNLLSEVDRLNFSPVVIPHEIRTVIEISDKPNNFEEIFRNSGNTKKISQEDKLRQASPPIETVDITSVINDCQSEHYISTVGNSPITAHGDLDEAPPSPEMLNQVYSPRNLELQNFSEFAKECNLKLRSGINYAGSVTSEDSCHSGVKRLKSLSPVVSLKRLSVDDINKWLPSPMSSSSENTHIDEVVAKKTVGLNKAKNITAKVKEDKPKEKAKNKKNAKIHDSNMEEMTNVKENNETPKLKRKSKVSKLVEVEMQSASTSEITKILDSPKLAGTARKSIISPINLDFDDYIPTLFGNKTVSEVSSMMQKSHTSESSVKHITRKKTKVTYSKTSESSTQFTQKRNNQTQIVNEATSTSERSELSMETVKKRSSRIEEIECKKRRVERKDEGSGANDRVREWLGSHVASIPRDEDHNACQDCIQRVMEKVETTLLEIHQATNDQFVQMFVSIEERQREAERDFLKEIAAKCEEFQKRSLLASRRAAAAALRADCRRKRELVAALLEDLAGNM